MDAGNVADPGQQSFDASIGLGSGNAAPGAMPTGDAGVSDEDVNSFLDALEQQKYGTPGQQALAGIEGIGRGLAGPLATGAETALGVSKEDILGREHANPFTSGAGEAAGLTAGLVTGTGEAAVMGKAGELAAEGLGLAKPASYLAKVGSAAVKQAAEMAVLQSGDEASKMILQDPNTSAQSALANIGLSAALGGAGGAFLTGAVSPLWQATAGKAIGAGLNTIKSFLDGTASNTGEIAHEAESLGVDLKPEVVAGMSDNDVAKTNFSTLNQSDTIKAGKTVQESAEEGLRNIDEAGLKTFDKSSADLENISKNDYDTANDVVGKIADEYEKVKAPAIELFDINNPKAAEMRLIEDRSFDRFEPSTDAYNPSPVKVTETVPGTVKDVSDKINQRALQEDWFADPSSPIAKMVRGQLRLLSNQETVGGLLKQAQNLGSNFIQGNLNGGERRAGQIIRNILEEGAYDAAASRTGESGGVQAVENIMKAKDIYKQAAQLRDALQERLHLKGTSVNSYANDLRKAAKIKGDKLLSRLSGTKDANLLDFLQKNFPDAAETLRQYHLDRMLKDAAKKDGFNVDTFAKNLFTKEKISPQLRDFVLSPEAQARIQRLSELRQKLYDSTYNWSNTARTIEKMKSWGILSPVGAIGAFISGHFGLGALLEAAPELIHLTKEGVGAGRLSMLRFIGSEGEIKPVGFDAMAKFIQASMKGQTMVNKAVQNVFKPGAQVLTDKLMPFKGDRDKLDKKVSEFADNPGMLQLLMNGHVGHYLPQHQEAMVQSVTNSLNYLSQLKPKSSRLGPLDPPQAPSPASMARYNRALDIAINPAVVLQHVKSGTVQPSDLVDLQNLYPDLYNQIKGKVADQIAETKSKGTMIPYNTRMGLSLFLGQPMDSSMTPASIQAAQPQPQVPPAAQGGGTKHSTAKLGQNIPGMRTPAQASENRHLNHK